MFGKENFRKELDNCSIESVKIWREWERTDILAEITLSNEKKYALFVEIKAYSRTSEKQLERYKTACERYDYKGKGFEEKFALLGAWENDSYSDFDKKCCDACGFSICTFQEILENIFTKGETTFESSGNELFDEFWAGKW